MGENKCQVSFRADPEVSIYRLVLLSYVPSGFWSRLITRLLAEDSIVEVLRSYFNIPRHVGNPFTNQFRGYWVSLNWLPNLIRFYFHGVPSRLINLIYGNEARKYSSVHFMFLLDSPSVNVFAWFFKDIYYRTKLLIEGHIWLRWSRTWSCRKVSSGGPSGAAGRRASSCTTWAPRHCCASKRSSRVWPALPSTTAISGTTRIDEETAPLGAPSLAEPQLVTLQYVSL